MEYDVIGDVHGQNLKLKALLTALGYRVHAGAYRHPAGRIAVFVGDLIDRGPGQVEVLGIVRRMEAAGSARVVMGNHELNAIGYATRGEDGVTWLRRHSAENEAQHRGFLDQVGWDTPLHRECSAGSGRCPSHSIWAAFGSATRGGTTNGLSAAGGASDTTEPVRRGVPAGVLPQG